MLLGFIERNEEHIQIILPEKQHPFAFSGYIDLMWGPMTEPCKDLVAWIGTMQWEPWWKTEIEIALKNVCLFFQIRKEAVDLMDHPFVPKEGLHTGKDIRINCRCDGLWVEWVVEYGKAGVAFGIFLQDKIKILCCDELTDESYHRNWVEKE
jgi:hypothetical protein